MDINILNSLYTSFHIFISETLMLVPKLIAAYILWLVGKKLIEWTVSLIDKADIRQWEIDDKVRGIIKKVFVPVAKFILVLVILDTFGIGSTVIAALLNGLTYTIAIALGIAFGHALQEDANMLVNKVRNQVK